MAERELSEQERLRDYYSNLYAGLGETGYRGAGPSFYVPDLTPTTEEAARQQAADITAFVGAINPLAGFFTGAIGGEEFGGAVGKVGAGTAAVVSDVAENVSSFVGGIASFLGNPLLYIGLAIVAIIIIVIVLKVVF